MHAGVTGWQLHLSKNIELWSFENWLNQRLVEERAGFVHHANAPLISNRMEGEPGSMELLQHRRRNINWTSFEMKMEFCAREG